MTKDALEPSSVREGLEFIRDWTTDELAEKVAKTSLCVLAQQAADQPAQGERLDPHTEAAVRRFAQGIAYARDCHARGLGVPCNLTMYCGCYQDAIRNLRGDT